MADFENFHLPDDLYYQADDHLWVRLEGDLARIGLDDVAQRSAQSITNIRLKPAGRCIALGKPFGTMEAGKYVGPLRMPLTGAVVEINEPVMNTPRLPNTEPYGAGWLVLVSPENLPAELPGLVHGPALQAWLESSVANWRGRGLLK